MDGNEDTTFVFQVWRPGPGVEMDGCYGLIGQDTYANLDFGGGLVDRTLEPEGFLSVQPGDVVGARVSSRDGIRSEQREREKGEEVWYQGDVEPFTAGTGSCQLTVGTEGDRTLRSFTNSAPILSVDIGKLKSDLSAGLVVTSGLSRGRGTVFWPVLCIINMGVCLVFPWICPTS